MGVKACTGGERCYKWVHITVDAASYQLTVEAAVPFRFYFYEAGLILVQLNFNPCGLRS